MFIGAPPLASRVIVIGTSIGFALLLLACSDAAPAAPRLGEAVTPPATDAPSADDPVAAAPPPSQPPSQPPPPPALVPTPTVDPSMLMTAPAGHERIFLRVGYPLGRRYRNLSYEGNNPTLRGPREPEGTFALSGERTAGVWRELIGSVRRVVAFRDSLFGQQDHPVGQHPHALMLPPSWVTTAVVEVASGRIIRPVQGPALLDDAAWAELDTPAKMFGSFPASDTLHEVASASTRDAPHRGRIMNARTSVRSLAADVAAMAASATQGAEAVARVGAERMAASDRRYFGESLRRKVVLLSVENPNARERSQEGKGLVPERMKVSPSQRALVRDAVYGRRLVDGPMGIERYNLASPVERRRAIDLLEALIPSESRGHVVWLWVNGGSDGHGRGDDARPYVQAFRAEVRRARIERSRLRLMNKPSVEVLAGDVRGLEQALAEFGRLDLPLSLKMRSRGLQSLLLADE